jgi:asparagine synthase (glutamine-hydrolysing)
VIPLWAPWAVGECRGRGVLDEKWELTGMCGIAGLFDPTAGSGADRLGSLVTSMAVAVAHRGPDDCGTWVDADAGIAFGHRRLAIVGLGDGGAQPMVSSGGRWVITYNGEIYNHREIRARLGGDGSHLRGGSDTEVLLDAIEQWGVDRALDACEGMFSMGLWDRQQRRLHLVRDRFGEKPLYFGWVGGCFAFGSELKALTTLPRFSAQLDRGAVVRYLRHNCIPAPHTIYQGVHKVLPGHVVTVSSGAASGSSTAQRCYWSMADAVDRARARSIVGSEVEMADELESTLSSAVSVRMEADVPVGAFLSGGIDSSTIVALMQQHATTPVNTFTVGFEDPAFDESGDAAAVAAHLGTNHTAVQVGDAEATSVIRRIPDIWDEPFADVSQIPTFLVSEVARSQVSVSLSGDGGDELFAGYNRHAWLDRVWRQAGVLPPQGRRATGSVISRIPPAAVDRAAYLVSAVSPRLEVRNPSTKIAKLAKVLMAADPAAAYHGLTTHWDNAQSLVLGGPQVDSGGDRVGAPALSGITEQMLWLDLVGYLPNDILAKVDRAAMAVSLETRVPFLDRQILGLAWGLPLDAKLRRGQTKWLLRQVLDRYVPAQLVDRPKMGFGLPIGSWLRGELAPWADHLLSESRLVGQGLLDPEPIRRAWDLHRTGRRDLGYELWDILVLQAWIDRWMPTLNR